MMECKAVIMSTRAADALMESVFGADGTVSRADGFSYRICFYSNDAVIRFRDRMFSKGILVGTRVIDEDNTTVVPEHVTAALLADKLGVKKILRTFLQDDELVVLLDE